MNKKFFLYYPLEDSTRENLIKDDKNVYDQMQKIKLNIV